MVFTFVLQREQRVAALPEDVFFPCEQFATEILALAVVHERFVFGRPVGVIDRLQRYHTPRPPSDFAASYSDGHAGIQSRNSLICGINFADRGAASEPAAPS